MLGLGVVATLVLALGAPSAGAEATASTDLFISEYIEGTSNNKAIEIYNGTGATVDLNAAGYSLSYYFNGSASAGLVISLTGTVADGDVYVVAQGSAAAAILQQADQTSSAGWFNGNDAVVLRKGGAAGPIVDVIGQVGLDPGVEWGSGAASTMDNTLRRKPTISAGDTNASDAFVPALEWDGFATDTFGGLGSHTVTQTVDLTIDDVSASEGNAGTSSFDFTVSLSTPAGPGGVTFDVATADGTASSVDDYAAKSLAGQTIPAGSSTYKFSVLVNGDTTEEADETFLADVTNVAGATVADARGQGAIVNDDTNFCVRPYTPIYGIQGNGLSAAITGNVTTQGVVVGDFEGTAGQQGFYLQDATGDGDATTSDGIFVFTGGANTVDAGDAVRVTGFARERFNQTALNGSNTNTSPVTNILDCGSGSVAPTDVTMPFAGLDFPERFEGMLVRLPQALVISEYFNYDRFGETVLALPLPGESRPFTPTAVEAPGAPAQARASANSLRRLTLDDGLGIQNPDFLRHPNGAAFALDNRFRGGDTVRNTVGVVGFDFSVYRIQPTGPAAYTEVNPRTAAPEPVGGSLRVAAMNTLNFFLTPDYPTGNPLDNRCGPAQNVECRGADADQPIEFTRQRDKLLHALAGLDGDIIGLNELENTAGVDPLGGPANGVVAGLNSLLGAGTYARIDTGVIGTDAIRVGLIYRPAKVAPVGAFKVLTRAVDARFIDTKSRPALAQTFEQLATGARFTVVVNHLKSKGSDCNDVGDPDIGDGQGNCNQTRHAAAEALVDWLATDPTASGDADFLIVGDLNSYAMEDPVTAIKAGPDDLAGTRDDYRNLVAHYLGRYAYSYVFDGQAGYLDHALSSSSLTPQVTGVAEWHINADEPDVLDYDTSFKGVGQRALYEPNAYRSSDHDPILVGLGLATTFDDLCRLTRRVVSKADVGDGLCDKLATAEAADEAGNANERDNALNAYRLQVDAQTGKSIAAADAATLKSLSLALQ